MPPPDLSICTARSLYMEQMLRGRQSSTPAGIEEPDDLHVQLISSGTGAFTGQCKSLWQHRNHFWKERGELFRRRPAERFRISAARQSSGWFHEPTRVNCITARIVSLPSVISLPPQVNWICRDYVTCLLMGGISFIPGQKSRILTQVIWSAGSDSLHAITLVCVCVCLQVCVCVCEPMLILSCK